PRRPFDATAAREAQQASIGHNGACLFADFASERLLPILISLGSSAWKVPGGFVIGNDDHFARRNYADTCRPVRLALGYRRRRMPGQPPAVAAAEHLERDAVKQQDGPGRVFMTRITYQ